MALHAQKSKWKIGDKVCALLGASGLASVIIPMAKAFGIRVIITVLTREIANNIKHLKVKNVWPKVESGEVKPTIYKVLPIQEAEAAHDILYRGRNVGNLVLTIL